MHDRAGRPRRGRPAARLAVPPAWAERLAGFARREGLPIAVVPGRAGAVRVVEPKGRRASTAAVLSVGGWIACPAARRLAARLGLPLRPMGRLLDMLRIKIKDCDLGCF